MNHEADNHETNDVDRWIDSLLRCEFAAELESPPRGLVVAIRAATTRRRRQRRFIAGGSAAAAALVVAAGWTLSLSRLAERKQEEPALDITANFAAAEPAPNPSLKGRGTVNDGADPEPPRATFVGTGETIAVPIESAQPDVTIVQTYSTLDAQRRRELMAGIYSISQPDGG